jgi:tRNA A37 threonylcarbamoyladenosine synthetase subunit TsaC/SUA5/YrdC
VKIFDVRTQRVEDAIEEAARVVFAGGTLVYPDETGYVVACDPHRDGIAVVYAAAAAAGASVSLCVASATELLEFAADNALAAIAVRRLAVEPVTFIVRRPACLEYLRGADSVVAFRVPEDPLARMLLDRCGPLVTSATSYTGAGLEGLPHVDVLLDRGEIAQRREASVVDLTGDRARLVFEGAVPFDRLLSRFGALEYPR